MKRDPISTILLLTLASLPLLSSLLLRVLGQSVFNSGIAYPAAISSFIYTVLSLNKIVTWQQYIKVRLIILILVSITLILNLGALQMLILLGLGRDSTLMLDYQRVTSFVAILFIFSLVNFLIMETVFNQVIPLEIELSPDYENKIIVGLDNYLTAIKWLFAPILGSVFATVVTYFLFRYENSLGNQGTVFGLYLGILMFVKQKADDQRKSRLEKN